MRLFGDEVLRDRVLDLRVGDDDEVPRLGVRAGGAVARGVDDQLEVLTRNDVVGLERARRDPPATTSISAS